MGLAVDGFIDAVGGARGTRDWRVQDILMGADGSMQPVGRCGAKRSPFHSEASSGHKCLGSE